MTELVKMNDYLLEFISEALSCTMVGLHRDQTINESIFVFLSMSA